MNQPRILHQFCKDHSLAHIHYLAALILLSHNGFDNAMEFLRGVAR